MLKGRTVCDVTEFHITHPLLGKIAQWKGSVEEEYFSIIFAKGILTVSLVEREHYLDQSAVNYAISERLLKILSKSENETVKKAGILDYHFRQYPKEQEDVSFTDVMVVLEWKYKERAKIYYDILSD